MSYDQRGCGSTVIKGKEGWEEVVMVLPGIFLYAKNEDDVIMTTTRKLVELMVMFDPHIYCRHTIMNEKGESMFYMNVQKALCGMLKSA